jgi:hypothetical protein
MLLSSQVWKPTYFIFELPDLLLLYRSRDDYIYNPKVGVPLQYVNASSSVTYVCFSVMSVPECLYTYAHSKAHTRDTSFSNASRCCWLHTQSVKSHNLLRKRRKRKLLQTYVADHTCLAYVRLYICNCYYHCNPLQLNTSGHYDQEAHRDQAQPHTNPSQAQALQRLRLPVALHY